MGSLKKLEGDLQRAEAKAQPIDALRAQLNSLQFNTDEAKDETRRLGERIGALESPTGTWGRRWASSTSNVG
jgi:hypothetical protein